MNEEFYSIGRGSLNINGKFYYGLDYQITDLMINLEQENKQLKENNLAMQEEMARTWAKLQQKEDIIDKAKEEIQYLESNCDISNIHTQKLKQILNNKGE